MAAVVFGDAEGESDALVIIPFAIVQQIDQALSGWQLHDSALKIDSLNIAAH